jgi:hypothetical protein
VFAALDFRCGKFAPSANGDHVLRFGVHSRRTTWRCRRACN